MKRAIAHLLCFVLLATVAAAQTPVHSADAYKRGLTDKDFPHRITLADNVYAIEILPAQGPNANPNNTRITTNSMVVVTTDGVLLGYGQGSAAAAKLLMGEIAKLTPQPIKY